MRKVQRIFILALMGMTAILSQAVPANPVPVNVAQPDGDSLTIVLHGDEFYHFTTTLDGFTLLQTNGRWEYAIKQNGSLRPSGVVAHNQFRRAMNEMQFVQSLEKNMIDDRQVQQGRQARASRDNKNVSREPVVDYSSFRGLILLIEFSDKSFGMTEPQEFYNDMANTKDYQGFYTGSGWNRRFNRCTGSVRDYFYDQSMGQFDPQFDVVGPVKVPFSCYEGNDLSHLIFKAALDSVDDVVDFTQYDSDHNGEIDMVFFMVAGYASSYSGNNEGYLWPHMSYLYEYDEDGRWKDYLHYDDMNMGRYASSTEIYGWEDYGMTTPNGIGTVCHEFGHVLGLPDLYDTDYSGGGGQSNDPGDWDVMAAGSHANYGRTPVGYSIWERTELGWADPITLDEGTYTLGAIHETNEGFMLQSPVEGEIFMFENRQQVKWDAALPAHGLLVARVDYTNPRVWGWNTVNADPSHNYYELVRAGATAETTPFPGTTKKTELNATSDPMLVTWAGIPCDLGLEDIAENNGVITFTVQKGENLGQLVEDFETMPLSPDNMQKGVQGQFATWDFVQADVAAVEQFESPQSCVMAMPSAITMTSDVNADIFMVTVEAVNPSSTEAKLQLSYSLDKGAKWTVVSAASVPGNESAQLTWRVSQTEPVRFRVTRVAGNKTQPLYIDNFAINYTGEPRPIEEALRGDLNHDGQVDVTDVSVAIDMVLGKADPVLTDADLNGDGTVDVTDVSLLIDIVLGK